MLECFQCSPKPGKWENCDPEGTSTASNHLRTELRPPICLLEGMTGPPYEGKGVNRDGDLWEKWPDGYPQISRSPRRVKSRKIYRGSKDLGPRTSNPLLKHKQKLASSMFSSFPLFMAPALFSCHPALYYSMEIARKRPPQTFK